MTKVLAVASGGGHWEQLMLLREAFQRHETAFATTDPMLAQASAINEPRILPDCNQDQPLRLIRCLLRAFQLVFELRPDVVVSTGAAPGLMCILAGRVTGARTLWIDSVANAERLSLSGRIAAVIAHCCLTQWEHLADPPATRFAGSVL